MIDLEAPPWLFSKKTLRNWSRFASDLRRRHPGDFSFCPISGGCCVWKRVLKEDEVPNLHVQQAEESKDCLFL